MCINITNVSTKYNTSCSKTVTSFLHSVKYHIIPLKRSKKIIVVYLQYCANVPAKWSATMHIFGFQWFVVQCWISKYRIHANSSIAITFINVKYCFNLLESRNNFPIPRGSKGEKLVYSYLDFPRRVINAQFTIVAAVIYATFLQLTMLLTMPLIHIDDSILVQGRLRGLTGSAAGHRYTTPGFNPRPGYVRRVFNLSLRLITFRGRSVYFPYPVHKYGRNTATFTCTWSSYCAWDRLAEFLVSLYDHT